MTDWYQQVLTTPDVIELRIRVGVVPETDHAQVMVEMFDPVTRVQQGMASIPHGAITEVPHFLAWAVQRAQEWLDEAIEPF